MINKVSPIYQLMNSLKKEKEQQERIEEVKECQKIKDVFEENLEKQKKEFNLFDLEKETSLAMNLKLAAARDKYKNK